MLYPEFRHYAFYKNCECEYMSEKLRRLPKFYKDHRNARISVVSELINYDNYYCKSCKKLIKRESDKMWANSFCESAGKNVRIYRKD